MQNYVLENQYIVFAIDQIFKKNTFETIQVKKNYIVLKFHYLHYVSENEAVPSF